jgi:Acetyltransferase (GNAT) domain
VRVARVQYESTADQAEWDGLAARLGGSFFHCHAHVMYQAAQGRAQPLFVRAYDRAGACVGVAAGVISSPRYWPFSRSCKTAAFGSLPATGGVGAPLEQEILAGVEPSLHRQGVFALEVHSYESPSSGPVLSCLQYEPASRGEFYLDLSRDVEELWARMKGMRRTNVRKANRLGVETRQETSLAALERLYGFVRESLQRRGVAWRAPEGQAELVKDLLLDPGRALLAVSYWDGEPINAALFGLFAGKAYYLSGGSSLVGNSKYGPAHLFWTAVETLKAGGFTSLNLGGVPLAADEPDSQGLFSFKQDFGADLVVQPAGRKVLAGFGSRLNGVLLRVKRSAATLRSAGAGRGDGADGRPHPRQGPTASHQEPHRRDERGDDHSTPTALAAESAPDEKP